MQMRPTVIRPPPSRTHVIDLEGISRLEDKRILQAGKSQVLSEGSVPRELAVFPV